MVFSSKKVICIFISALFLLAILGLLFKYQSNFRNLFLSSRAIIIERVTPILQNTEDKSALVNDASDTKVTLLFAGDIMLSRSVGDKMLQKNDWRWPFLKITDYFKSADLVFGNLEGPISDGGKNVGSIYSFRADPRVATGLSQAGFRVLSVANNHIGDWGRVAMEDTFKYLEQVGIGVVGGGANEKIAHQPLLKEIRGTKIAFLAYTTLGARYMEAKGNLSGIAWVDKKRLVEDLIIARELVDIVAVSLHFGEEYQKQENNFQREMAHLAIDSGADLVVGHHPHIVQGFEKYKDGYIAYSLGNFIFDQNFSEETINGLLLKVILADKKINQIERVPIKINSEYQAEIKID